MAKLHKVYRFRMRPTKVQEHALNRMAGARRFIWNWGLARKREHYQATGKNLSYFDQTKELTELKRQPGMEWLREINSNLLEGALRDLDLAFTNFFQGRARYPRFKSRKCDPLRFRIRRDVKLTEGMVYVPKIGHIRIRQSRPVEEKIKNATFKRAADGKWHVSLMVEFEMPDVPLPTPDPAKVVGIDLGLIDFATPSDGSDPIPAPKFFRKGQRKLRKAQKAVSRRKPGSKRKAEARARLARVHRKIANQRSDFLHKLSTDLIRDHDAVVIEDLCVKGLARTKLAKSFTDASMGEFRRMLEYKALWNRKHLIAVGRFFPSSRMCNACGALNGALTLSDREWDCACGTHHKRDFLAACNIRDEGLRMLAVGQTDSLNAQGDTVRPGMSGLVSVN